MIKPLGDNVLVKRLEAEEKTQGGIILASSAKEEPQVAEVIEVGPGTADVKMEGIAKGSKVIFKKYGGNEIEYQGEKYIILPYDTILAVVE
ncbi:MAG: co-chaperone GroES [Anaerovoracaceae bacterium]|nr:co-chaperone GroES [Anaerovoracaceae bacterium]